MNEETTQATQREHVVPRLSHPGLPDKASVRAETMEDGRYIPYSGGLMGWFENRGVPRRELPNNYRFHTVIDAQAVRRKLFERWGKGETGNRRVSPRFEIEGNISVSLEWEGNKLVALGKDISSYGLRLQIQQEEVMLKKGDMVHLKIYNDPEQRTTKFDIESQIMWIDRIGRRRPVWNLGVSFPTITMEESDALKEFFKV